MWLHRVEKTYCFDPDMPNEYHTSWHAADVLQTVCCVLQTQIIANRLSELDKLTLIVAAVMHDYRHKGVTNKYLIQVKDDIAYDHNDMSVLERFHCQQTFVVLKDPKFNFLVNLTEHDYREFRRKLILLILATDLGEGFKYISAFKNAVESESESENHIKEPLMQMILKLADVSHPCKEWGVHRQWTDMITKEFYKQGRAEAALNMPISPLCDETKADLAKSQQGFINFVVNPIVQPLAEYCSNFVWTRQLHENYQRWGTEQLQQKQENSRAKSSEKVLEEKMMGGGDEGPS
jgi:calcium/calmodulin-dependent 3',5'-cyclic nucleotide phosphodiesterase